jgi:hypothetical protein
LEELTKATRHEGEHLCGHHLVMEHLLPLCLLLLSYPLKDHPLSLLVLLKLILHLLLHLKGSLSLRCESLDQGGELVWLGHLSSGNLRRNR